MKFEQNEVSKKFVEEFQRLKENRVFTSQLEAAEKLDYSPNSLSEILKGKRDVTIDLLRKFFITYNINPSSIFESDKKNKENEIKLAELNTKKINLIYQRIIDVYVISSSLDFPTNWNETNVFADRRNIIIDDEPYENKSIEKLIISNRELAKTFDFFEECFSDKFKELLYNVTTLIERPKAIKPLKKKK